MAAAAQWHDAAITLAAAFRTQRPGDIAAEVLAEVAAGVRQGELVTCLAIERTDRTGEFAADGAASTAAYVRGMTNETGSWASMRVKLGRALVDRLPATRAAWEAGALGFSPRLGDRAGHQRHCRPRTRRDPGPDFRRVDAGAVSFGSEDAGRPDPGPGSPRPDGEEECRSAVPAEAVAVPDDERHVGPARPARPRSRNPGQKRARLVHAPADSGGKRSPTPPAHSTSASAGQWRWWKSAGKPSITPKAATAKAAAAAR